MDAMNNFFENELTANGLRELQDFIEGNGLFRILQERNYQSATVFWKAASIFYPELSLLAEKLITGELERLFSQWAYVHSQGDDQGCGSWIWLKLQEVLLYDK